MGWCPHATSNSPDKKNFFAISSIAAPKSSGNSSALPSSWWNKRHNRALIYSGLTLFSIIWIGFQGVHLRDEVFIFGLIIGIAFNLYLCISDWHNLDNIDKMKNSSKKIQMKLKSIPPKLRVINSILSLILLCLLFLRFGGGYILTIIFAFCLAALLYYFNKNYSLPLILLLSAGSSSGWRSLLTFTSGFCLTAFLLYLTAIYWEKKNKKIVLIYGHNIPEIYIVNSGAE